ERRLIDNRAANQLHEMRHFLKLFTENRRQAGSFKRGALLSTILNIRIQQTVFWLFCLTAFDASQNANECFDRRNLFARFFQREKVAGIAAARTQPPDSSLQVAYFTEVFAKVFKARGRNRQQSRDNILSPVNCL